MVKTDNVATNYFASQPKLSPKQAPWQDFLAKFDLTIGYRKGKLNVVAYALSKKAQLASSDRPSGAPSAPTGDQPQILLDLRQRVKEEMARDATALAMLKQVKEGKMHKFQTDGELLYFGERMYVPKSGNLRKEVLRECPDSFWAEHPGQH